MCKLSSEKGRNFLGPKWGFNHSGATPHSVDGVRKGPTNFCEDIKVQPIEDIAVTLIECLENGLSASLVAAPPVEELVQRLRLRAVA